MSSYVTREPAAAAEQAKTYFESRLSFETDCWDVHDALSRDPDFVLLDIRSESDFAAVHVPGAINLPYRALTEEALAPYPNGTLFVVYCNGPHCNAAMRAGARIAGLGKPVKEMLGGMLGWIYSGFPTEGLKQGAAHDNLMRTVGEGHDCAT